MIANITNGRDFGGLFRYLTGDRDSNGLVRDEVSDLGGTVPGSTPAEWSRAMEAISAAHPSVNVKVKHWSLRFAPEDMQSGKVNYGLMSTMASEFSERMGATAWRAFSHGDHFHIAANRIRHDGTVIKDHWDYRMAEEICRDFEKRYGLREVKSSTELEPTEHRKRPTQGELNAAIQSGTPSNRMILQEIVDNALSEEISASDFIDILKMNGVDVRFNTNKSGISGVTFSYDGMFFKGQSLGKAYTAGNLKKRGLSYVEIRDRQRVEQSKGSGDYDSAEEHHSSDARGVQGDREDITGVRSEVLRGGGGSVRGDQADYNSDIDFDRETDRGVSSDRSGDDIPHQDGDTVRGADGEPDQTSDNGVDQSDQGSRRENGGSLEEAGRDEATPSRLSRRLLDRGGHYDDLVAMVLADEIDGNDGRRKASGDVQGRGFKRLLRDSFRVPTDTMKAIAQHIRAIGVDDFEVAILPPTGVKNLIPFPRQFWKKEDFFNPDEIAKLKARNAKGYEIYIAPGHAQNQGLVFLDDIPKEALEKMKEKGFTPVSFIESSPGNFQATIRVSDVALSDDEATECGRILARMFGGDPKSSDWRHLARLAGFTNRKPKHIENNRGLAPFVKLHHASSAKAEKGDRLVAIARQSIEKEKIDAAARRPSARVLAIRSSGDVIPRDASSFFLRHAAMLEKRLKRDDGSTNWSDVDYGVAAEMLKHGFSRSDVVSAMIECSPEIDTRKSDVQRYVDRTVDKAMQDQRLDPNFRR